MISRDLTTSWLMRNSQLIYHFCNHTIAFNTAAIVTSHSVNTLHFLVIIASVIRVRVLSTLVNVFTVLTTSEITLEWLWFLSPWSGNWTRLVQAWVTLLNCTDRKSFLLYLYTKQQCHNYDWYLKYWLEDHLSIHRYLGKRNHHRQSLVTVQLKLILITV